MRAALILNPVQLLSTLIAEVLARIFGAITNVMKAGNKVTVVGFDTLSVSERVAREGRNPQSGEPISILAKKVVKLKAWNQAY